MASDAPDPVFLLGAIESISSKKITQGEACLAFLNTSLIPFSDSPTHLDNNSGPLILMKLDSDVVATAFAIKVFPVPGGPYNKRPLGGLTSPSVNNSGYLSGHSTTWDSSSLTLDNPPISSQVTLGR